MQAMGDYDDWMRVGLRWAEQDPDPETSREMRRLVASGDATRVRDCCLPPLEFGTAGLRGIVGPGPARMNLAVIRRVTRALAEVAPGHAAPGEDRSRRGMAPIVVGFDGRTDSRRFAEEAVGVLAATALPVAYFEQPVPTPVVAYAALRLRAPAAVVVTASHNPPEYNGYKVYGAEAIQIVPPFDDEVTSALDRIGPACEIPCAAPPFDGCDQQVVRLDDGFADGYVEAVLSGRVRGAASAEIRIAYTPLHGVGAYWTERVFEAAGYHDFYVEPSQRDPDGRFPTVRFPNPEEPGALTRGLRLASEVDADLLLANDPDADRMAAALKRRDAGYRILSGNEVGVILTDYILAHTEDPSMAAVATTIVSTPMVREVVAHYGAHHEVTLTGFKWLWTAMRSLETHERKRFALCWEEALGYSTHSAVRDKDGIAAALVFADWVSECHALGIRPVERLSELYRRHGAWGSAPRNVVRPGVVGVAEIRRMMRGLLEDPPARLAGRPVVSVTDYRQGASARATWCGAADMVLVELEGAARIVVRPSGTEPKLKCYADVHVMVAPGEDPLATYDRAVSEAESLNEALVHRLEVVLSSAP